MYGYKIHYENQYFIIFHDMKFLNSDNKYILVSWNSLLIIL